MLLNGRIWGGKRYYDRLHLDINDQFLEIEDGDGAGVENMDIGFGKLSVAFLMNPNSEADQVPNPAPTGGTLSTANFAPFRLTARITDIPTIPDGALQIWAAWYGSSTSPDQANPAVVIPEVDNRFRLAIYHTLNGVLGGSNLVGAKAEYSKNRTLWRVVMQQQMLFNSGHTGFDVIGEYRSTRTRATSDADWAQSNWASLGARFDTQIVGPLRFLAEAGIDRLFGDI